MRELGFDVVLSGGEAETGVFVLRIGRAHSGPGLIEEGIIGGSYGALADILGLARGVDPAFSLGVAGGREVHIRMAGALLAERWVVAAILNLIDAATFLGQDDDEPFLDGVEVRHASCAGLSLADVEQALSLYRQQCSVEMTALLPADFKADPWTGRQWPESPRDYLFDVTMELDSALGARSVAEAQRLMTNLDTLVAQGAFEPNGDLTDWIEEGNLPYPVDIEARPEALSYKAEMPPTDIAPALLLMRDILARHYNAPIRSWSFNIREGW